MSLVSLISQVGLFGSEAKRDWGMALNRLKQAGQAAVHRGQPPLVFVYQMGKVGSKAIAKSLYECWPGPVVHGHAVKRINCMYPDVSALYWRFLRNPRPLYVISFAREPISRNISAYFQAHGRNEQLLRRNSAYLKKHFLSHYNHSLVLRWFDKFFAPWTGIDVYQKELCRGGATYRCGNVQALVLCVEMPNERRKKPWKNFSVSSCRNIARGIQAQGNGTRASTNNSKAVFDRRSGT
jgi:hypothetical protein